MQTKQYISLHGKKIYYEFHEIDKARPTIIFLHDSLGCTQLWRDFPKEIAEKTKCNILVYDRQGYGKSSPFTVSKRELNYMHLEAAFLHQLIQQFQLNEIILFGHSDGGTIALLYATKFHQNLKGMIVVGSHVIVEDVTLNGIKEAVKAYRETNLKERLIKYHGDNTQKVFEMWTETWLRPDFIHFDIREELKNIECPTLVIQGVDDEFGSMKQVDGIMDFIQVRKEAFLVPDAKHTPYKENKIATLDKIIEFIHSL